MPLVSRHETLFTWFLSVRLLQNGLISILVIFRITETSWCLLVHLNSLHVIMRTTVSARNYW